MQKKRFKSIRNNKGITLIALIITIIVLLILAGVSLSLIVGENGILNKATNSVIKTKIKEIEEVARLSYMDRQVDEIVDGKAATMAGVVSDLKEKGYTIKEEGGASKTVTGIVLSEENVTVERSTGKTVTYTLVYAEGIPIRYFAEVQGKYYEIDFNNGDITVNIEPANLGEPEKEPEVTVESSDISIIKVTKIEEGNLLLTAQDKIGDVEIIVKEVNSNVEKKITATTRIPVKGISIIPTSATINVGATTNLTVTVEPSNATDQTVTWNSSDTGVATVANGVVTGIAGGTTTITASANGITSNACTVTVKEPTMLDKVKENPADFYGKKVKGYTANGISDWRIFYADDENVFIITTDYVPNSKVPTSACGMTTYGTYNVYWNSVPTVASTTNVVKFSPVTSETMAWAGDYGTNVNGKCLSTLLDTSKWTSFVDSKYATMAIGSPTLNMWVASWNVKYPSEKLYCNNSNTTGYYVGDSSAPKYTSFQLESKSGYQVAEAENMYWPHKTSWNNSSGYWLASPSAYRSDNMVFLSGQILYLADCYNALVSVRPVVCLKSDVKMTENADGTVTIK